MKHAYRSYLLANEIPVYGGCGSLNIRGIKALHSGDPANIFSFTMENHWGIHIDCPAQFFKNGLSAADYPPGTWFFRKPFVLPLKLEENSLVSLENTNKISADLSGLISVWIFPLRICDVDSVPSHCNRNSRRFLR